VGSTAKLCERRGRARSPAKTGDACRNVLRRDVPKFKPNYTRAAFTLTRCMRSMPYADWLAHRNSVATKELASAVIAWVYRRAASLVVCEIPGEAHFLQPIASAPLPRPR
jgi:hypothetical protein